MYRHEMIPPPHPYPHPYPLTLPRPRIRWWECYNMVRRLMLTCMVALYDTLPSTTVFMVAVSIVTLVFEREAKPYIDPFLRCDTRALVETLST